MDPTRRSAPLMPGVIDGGSHEEMAMDAREILTPAREQLYRCLVAGVIAVRENAIS
jgi:hypothetical protein